MGRSFLAAFVLWPLLHVAPLDGEPKDRSLSRSDRLKAFDQIWTTIDRDFYDPGFNGADWKQARERYRPRAEAAVDDSGFYGAVDEMLAELKDSHTRFQRPPTYSGHVARAAEVGISAWILDGDVVVVAVAAGSAAERAGVRPGMLVREVDGEPMAQRLQTLAAALRRTVGIATERLLTSLASRLIFIGPAGTPAAIRLEEEGTELEVSLPRFTGDDLPLLTFRRLDSGLGYIRFRPWLPPNDRRFAEAVQRLQDAPGLIVDLRGNRGGSFMTADYFLPPGTFQGTATGRSGKSERSYTRKNPVAYRGRLAVLVDEESGSASENFAALIQESGRGRVIGRTTCGCFTSSYSKSVPGGGRLHWSRVLPRTLGGRKVEGAGVVPDTLVPLRPADLREGRDAVLDEAVKLLATPGP